MTLNQAKRKIGETVFYAQNPQLPEVMVKILSVGDFQVYVEVMEDKGGLKKGYKMYVSPKKLPLP